MLQWSVIVGLVALAIWRVGVLLRREVKASAHGCADCPVGHASHR